MVFQAPDVCWSSTRNLNFHFAPTFLITTNPNNNTERLEQAYGEETKDAVKLISWFRIPTLKKTLRGRQMERKSIMQQSHWGLHIWRPQYSPAEPRPATVDKDRAWYKQKRISREFSLFLSEKVLSIITWPTPTGNAALWRDLHTRLHNLHYNKLPNRTK